MFVLLGALGVALIAKHLKHVLLGVISATMIAICILELVLLARFNAHPVDAWVWTILQLILTPLLIYALYVIAGTLEQKRIAKDS